MSTNKAKVFLDANILIAAGKPPGGPQLARVYDLTRTDRITVLTTDLTMSEIARRHAQNDFKEIKEICRPSFRKTLEETMGIQVQEIEEGKLRENLYMKYRSSVWNMFKDMMGARTLTVNNVKPRDVFSDYVYGKGFFAEGTGKKDQFPDAFVFECLKQEASGKEPVIIVSNDKDFVQPVIGQQNISLVESLPGLFDKLGLKMEVPEIESFMGQQGALIAEMVEEGLSDWSFEGDIKDSEIHYISVDRIEVQETIAFRSAEEGKPILIIGSLDVFGTAYFTCPDWDSAIWDSEDKIAIPLGVVNSHTETEFNIDVSLSVEVNEKGDPEKIQELSVQEVYADSIALDPEFGY